MMQEQIDNAENTKEKLFCIGIQLFATKGYNSVGVRELCRAADIKESSFYNHYKGKAALLDAIFEKFENNMNAYSYSEEEIREVIDSKDVGYFLDHVIQKNAKSVGYPVFHLAMLIINMERFTNEKAHQLMKQNAYARWEEPTKAILEGFIDNGTIDACDVEMVTMEFYYAFQGIIDEYVQVVAWDEPFETISNRIELHMKYFTKLLSKEK